MRRSHSTPLTMNWLDSMFSEAQGDVCLPRNALYKEYLAMCERNFLEPVNAASFGKIIRKKFPHLTTKRLGTRGQSKYYYYGLASKHFLPTSSSFLLGTGDSGVMESGNIPCELFHDDNAAYGGIVTSPQRRSSNHYEEQVPEHFYHFDQSPNWFSWNAEIEDPDRAFETNQNYSMTYHSETYWRQESHAQELEGIEALDSESNKPSSSQLRSCENAGQDNVTVITSSVTSASYAQGYQEFIPASLPETIVPDPEVQSCTYSSENEIRQHIHSNEIHSCQTNYIDAELTESTEEFDNFQGIFGNAIVLL